VNDVMLCIVTATKKESAKHQVGRTQFNLNQSRYIWYLTWRPEFKSHSNAYGSSDLTGKCHYCCIHTVL